VAFSEMQQYMSFSPARAEELGRFVADAYNEMRGIVAELYNDPLSQSIVRRIISNPKAAPLFMLVLVWVVSASIPVASLAGSPEAQTALSGEYGTLAIALAITWRILDKRKR
jgi:hypothetical protein